MNDPGILNQSEALAKPDKEGAIGVFGGTFDPLHCAHLRLAIEAREILSLKRVLFVPAGQPPLRAVPQASPRQRLDMAACALAGEPDFELDDAEIAAGRPSYTVTTLERLRTKYGATRPLVLLIGADAFARLPEWHRWQALFQLAHIGVATRPGSPEQQKLGAGETAGKVDVRLAAEVAERLAQPMDIASAPAGRIVSFNITPLAISATLIRQRVAKGLSVRYLVPDTVLDYIQTHSIYRTHYGR